MRYEDLWNEADFERWGAAQPSLVMEEWRIDGSCDARTQEGRRCGNAAYDPTLGPVRLCNVHREALRREIYSLYSTELIDTVRREVFRITHRLRELRDEVGALAVERDEKREEIEKLDATIREAKRWIVLREPLSAKIRSNVRVAHANTCAYCELEGSDDFGPDGRWWHVDHVIPVSRGGTNDFDNLVLACATCNESKAASPVEEFLTSHQLAASAFVDWSRERTA